MFLLCGMRLVGIIGYRLAASLPTQPTSPEIGFFFESEYFGRVFGTSYCQRMRRPPDTQIATSTSTTQCWQCVSSVPPLRQAATDHRPDHSALLPRIGMPRGGWVASGRS